MWSQWVWLIRMVPLPAAPVAAELATQRRDPGPRVQDDPRPGPREDLDARCIAPVLKGAGARGRDRSPSPEEADAHS